MTPVALLVHAHPSTKDEYENALGIHVHLVNSRGGQYSSAYGPPNGIAARHPRIGDVLRTYARGVDPNSPVVLIGFSAGAWAVRHWLREEANRQQTIAAVFVDGLHAGGSDKEARITEAHFGVLDYAMMCREAPEKRCLVITHSHITPPDYASTRRTAQAIIERLGAVRHELTDNLHLPGFHVIGDEETIEGDEGAGGKAHRIALQAVGPLVCGLYVQPVVDAWSDEEAVSTTDPAPAPIPAWRDPELSLGYRRVLLARHEMAAEDPPSNETLAKYFGPCMRGGKNIGGWLAQQCLEGKRLNHCSATGGWLAMECLLEGETLPHQPRAGAKECMADAIRSHTWHKASEVLDGDWHPSTGDAAIYDRSKPGRPETAWFGHYDIVTKVSGDGYENIGANEGARGAWRDHQFTRYDHPRLLGFISFAQDPPSDKHLLSDAEVKDILALRDLTIAQTIAEAPWDD